MSSPYAHLDPLTVDPDRPNGDPGYVDVAAVLAGTLERPRARVALRTDGQGLFYRRAVNTLVGDPESGKSLIAATVASDVLFSGGKVLWLDLDHNGAPSILSRFRGFGVSIEALSDRDHFRLVCDVEDAPAILAFVTDAMDWEPDYVVVDSVGELLPLFGASSDSADDYTNVNRQVAAKLASSGACVVTIDHLAKGQDSRAYGASGTMAKKRAADGALYRVTLKVPFTPSSGGRADLLIVKDRHGDVRDSTPRSNREPVAASFVLTSKEGAQDWKFYAPDATEDTAPAKPRPEVTDVDVLASLDGAPKSKRDVQARLGWGSTRAHKALTAWREANA